MEFILQFTDPRFFTVALIALASFATVFTALSSLEKKDVLKQRMKIVQGEREKLRQAARQEAPVNAGNRLRVQQVNFLGAITDLFKLHDAVQASNVRDRLKQAGLRNEQHVYVFVIARLFGPFLLAFFTWAYTGLTLHDLSWRTQNLYALGGGAVGYFLPTLLLSNLISKRQKSIRRSWPDALDVMLICIESGMPLEPAMARVAREIGTQSVPLAEELTLTVAELSYLQDRRKAFENLAKRVNIPAVKSVVMAFIQSERYGTPLGQALRVLSLETRESRMQEAEKKAASLPSALTVPMILFFLPVVFVVILAPSVIQIMGVR